MEHGETRRVAEEEARHPPMRASLPDEASESLLPGEGYAIYSAGDVLGTLPADYELVLGRAAAWTGVDSVRIGRVVEAYEGRLIRWWEGVRRRERKKRVRWDADLQASSSE